MITKALQQFRRKGSPVNNLQTPTEEPSPAEAFVHRLTSEDASPEPPRGSNTLIQALLGGDKHHLQELIKRTGIIDLSGAQLEARDMDFLSKAMKSKALTSPIHLNLSKTTIIKAQENKIKRLITNKLVNGLDISYCQFKAGTLTTMLNSIKANKSITSLDVSFNQGSGVDELINDLLTSERALRILSCERISIRTQKMGNIITSIGASTTLEELNFSRNWLDEAQAHDLASALAKNRSLRVIDVSRSKITENSMTSILNSLQEHRGLLDFRFASQQCISEGNIKLLEKVLINNKLMTSIDLSGTLCDPRSLEEFCSILIQNRSLSNIGLARTRFSEKAIQDFGVFLCGSPFIRTINLSNCIVPKGSFKILQNAILSNPNITSLNIKNSSLKPRFVEELERLASTNESIHRLRNESMAVLRVFLFDAQHDIPRDLVREIIFSASTKQDGAERLKEFIDLARPNGVNIASLA